MRLPPRLPWASFLARFAWRQGEHLTTIGPTGTGKTTLLRAVLSKRHAAGGAVVILATKPRDATLTRWARDDDYTIIRSWPPAWPWWKATPPPARVGGPAVPWTHRIMLWPTFTSPEDVPAMAAVHHRAIAECFAAGNVCVVAEELHYLCAELDLDKPLVTGWTQGRSVGLTLAGGTQRPVNVPLYAYSNATHLFFFGDSDEVNLRRIQGLGGLSAEPIREMVRALPEHDVIYVNTRRKVYCRTRVQPPRGRVER